VAGPANVNALRATSCAAAPVTTRTLPVSEQLLSIERSPLGDQCEGAARQRAGDELAVEPDRRGLTSQDEAPLVWGASSAGSGSR
jgi:hypothetical protein